MNTNDLQADIAKLVTPRALFEVAQFETLTLALTMFLLKKLASGTA